MNLPLETIIAPAKLTQYLLVKKAENDKSQWLATAGYMQDTWQRLERDIREQILPLEARWEETNLFGEMYQITGILIGPNGVLLKVRTIWMIEKNSNLTKFITMYPDKERK